MSRRVRRLLLVFLNTGGGHRSAALAVAAALRELYGEQARVDPVDATVAYFPWPLSELDAIYRQLVRARGWPWAATYHLTNGSRRVALLERAWWLLTRDGSLRLLRDHPADVIVCCHPLLKAPLVRAIEVTGSGTPLITLVTDLVEGHASWFVPGDTRCLVPTKEARRCALDFGLPEESIRVTGLPVRPCFAKVSQEEPRAMRRRLGLDPDAPVVLLLSGADGVGPFHRLCRAIDDAAARSQLVMIAGRNDRLRAELSAETWSVPVRVEGFVHNVHEWMCAADLLVTKAGPGTISEALVMGLPMVLSGALPGQERPNVDYVVEAGAGVWAPDPDRAARAVQRLLSPGNRSLTRMAERARELSQPDAARRVAEIAWGSADGELA